MARSSAADADPAAQLARLRAQNLRRQYRWLERRARGDAAVLGPRDPVYRELAEARAKLAAATDRVRQLEDLLDHGSPNGGSEADASTARSD